MRIIKNEWLHIAGHPQYIASGHKHHWRAKIASTEEEITFQKMVAEGWLNEVNRRTKTNPLIPEGGLAAWIEYYGDFYLDSNDILHAYPKLPNIAQNTFVPQPIIQSREKVWMSLAVSKARLRSADTRHWRCFLGADTEEIPLSECIVRGFANSKNHITESQTQSDSRGLIAWIRHFGTFHLYKNGIALFALSTPTE